MKKIVLENNNFLRKHVKKIEIDNDDINFINGLAVVNATVYTFQLLQDEYKKHCNLSSRKFNQFVFYKYEFCCKYRKNNCRNSKP